MIVRVVFFIFTLNNLLLLLNKTAIEGYFLKRNNAHMLNVIHIYIYVSFSSLIDLPSLFIQFDCIILKIRGQFYR